MLNTVFLIYFLPGSKAMSARGTNSIHGENCKESPPKCSWKHTLYIPGKVSKDMKLPVNHDEDYTVVNYFIDSSHTICSLDPFAIVNKLHDVELGGIALTCLTPSTRLVIIAQDYRNNTLSIGFVIAIKSCSVYWKDIAVIGNGVRVNALHLIDWKDEFASDELEFFTNCVQLRNYSTDTESQSPGLVLDVLSNVSQILMLNPDVQPLSPVFTQHIWPEMTRLECKR